MLRHPRDSLTLSSDNFHCQCTRLAMFRTAVFLPHNRIIFLSVKGACSGTSPCCGRDEQVRASLLLSCLAWFAVLDAAGLALPSAPASGAAVVVPHPRVCSADPAVCVLHRTRASAGDRRERPSLSRGGRDGPAHRGTYAHTRQPPCAVGGGGRVCVNPRVTVAAVVCCRLPIHARPTAWASSGVRGWSARGRRPRPLPPGRRSRCSLFVRRYRRSRRRWHRRPAPGLLVPAAPPLAVWLPG